MDKLDYIKIKNICSSMDTIMRVKTLGYICNNQAKYRTFHIKQQAWLLLKKKNQSKK